MQGWALRERQYLSKGLSWKSYRPRLPHIQWPGDTGGPKSPDFGLFLLNATLLFLLVGCGGEGSWPTELGQYWVRTVVVKMSSLTALRFSGAAPEAKLIQWNFIVKNFLSILNQIKGACRVPSVSILAPICKNHSYLPPGLGVGGVHSGTRGVSSEWDLPVPSRLQIVNDEMCGFFH